MWVDKLTRLAAVFGRIDGFLLVYGKLVLVAVRAPLTAAAIFYSHHKAIADLPNAGPDPEKHVQP